ncbi:MAG TPA: DUF177 domain-containing protein [Candidatus Tectomicrobia bacterium]|nr:DUF177 domain-containing protein [Candidatus Tectomicrobia bacterium]
MIIRVSDLDEQGLSVDDVEALAFADPTWRLDTVALRVEPDGRDVFVRGPVRARVSQTCGRCAETFVATVAAEIDLRLSPRPTVADDVELARDDLDVDFYEGDLLDLSRLVEAETTLALPMKPLCRPDCRGVCPTCGVNRNLAPCACPPRAPDPRLAVLRDLGARRDHGA